MYSLFMHLYMYIFSVSILNMVGDDPYCKGFDYLENRLQ